MEIIDRLTFGMNEAAAGILELALGQVGTEQRGGWKLSSSYLIRAHADENRMTELAVRRELHAAHLDHLADQSFGLGFCPKDFALGICETGANRTPGRCDEAQPAAMLAPPFSVSSDGDVVRLLRLHFDPLVALTKDQALVVKFVGAVKLGAYVRGGGIGQTAPTKAPVEGVEAVEVLLSDRGRVFLKRSGPGRDDRVAKIADEDLAVASLAPLPRRNVTKRLVGSAHPATLVVPDRSDSVEFQRHQPLAGQSRSIP